MLIRVRMVIDFSVMTVMAVIMMTEGVMTVERTVSGIR